MTPTNSSITGGLFCNFSVMDGGVCGYEVDSYKDIHHTIYIFFKCFLFFPSSLQRALVDRLLISVTQTFSTVCSFRSSPVLSHPTA